MKPFAIKQLDHIVLRVRDLDRSVTFYSEILGCEVAKRRVDLGMVHLRAGLSMIDLVDVNGKLGKEGGHAAGDSGRNVDHFCLRIEPFEDLRLIEYLQRAGAAPSTAVMRYGAEGTGLSLYCVDPDGNQIELKGPSTLA